MAIILYKFLNRNIKIVLDEILMMVKCDWWEDVDVLYEELAVVVDLFEILSAILKLLFIWNDKIKNRSIGPELMTAKTGPIHLSSLVEIAFVDWFTKLLFINISIYMNI